MSLVNKTHSCEQESAVVSEVVVSLLLRERQNTRSLVGYRFIYSKSQPRHPQQNNFKLTIGRRANNK
jgi:hypothetical protein